MRFEYLVDCPDALPKIALWYLNQWGRLTEGETFDSSLERLQEYLNRDKIPFILVGLLDEEICAVGQLKFREMEEMFPEKEHWLGGVYVPEPHRGKGFGSEIASEIAGLAPNHGVSTLYLQTERLDGGLYSALGWHPIEQVNNRAGLEVLVMERHLDG